MPPTQPLPAPFPVLPGAGVAVIAPSGPVGAERLERGCELLRSIGVEPVLGRHLRGRVRSYLSGEDHERAADLEEAWLDPDIHAVICARGGYGSARLLDLLDWDKLGRAIVDGRPKAFIGSSDVTTLHQAFAIRLGVGTYYGPTLAGTILGEPDPCPRTVRSFADALFAPDQPVELAGGTCLVPGTAEGVLTGGTLAMICSLAGSRDYGSADGSVVLLEDVHESPYKIDRMLTQLLRSGWFDGVRAIACGEWTRCGPAEQVEEVLLERLGGLGVPVVTGLAYGHGETQLTVPLGRHATLDASAGVLIAA